MCLCNGLIYLCMLVLCVTRESSCSYQQTLNFDKVILFLTYNSNILYVGMLYTVLYSRHSFNENIITTLN